MSKHAVSLSGRRLLVVDDDDVRAFVTAVLEGAGAKVYAAADGAAALDAARLLRPVLITLDLSMPGRDGAEVLAELRGDAALCDIPVCIITGRPELRGLMYDRPVRSPKGFETKPIDPVRLVADLRLTLHLADRQRSREEAPGSM